MGIIIRLYGIFIAAIVFYIIGYLLKSSLLKKIAIALFLFGLVAEVALVMGMIKLT